MSEISHQIAQLEKELVGNKEHVELRDAALRLHENRDFRKVILDNFMLIEAARYVQTSGDPAMNPQQRADALAIAQASGHLKRYLSILIQIGNQSANAIPQVNQALDELRAEEDKG